MVATDLKTKVPEGWNQIQFGQLFVERKKSRLKVEEAFLGGQHPFFTSGEKVLSRNDYLSDGPHLFLATGGVANAKFFNGKASYSSDTYCIAGKDENTKLLFYTIWNNLSYINYHFFEGSGLKHLQKADFKKFKILFPQNPKEQQKIAEVLTTIDEAIEKTDAIIEKNKRIQQGLMQDLFRYGIDEHGNIRSEKTHKFKTVRIGNEEMRIPEEWEMGNITDYLYIMTDYVANGSFSSLNENVNVYDTENYAYYVRLYDLRLGLGHKNQTYVDKSSYLFLRKSFVEYEDILIANIGAYAGMVWSVPKLDKKATIAPNMLILKTNDKSEKKYLYYYLKSQIGDKEINNVIGGSGQPKISKTELKTIEIIKISKSEQRRIINVLKSSDKIIKKEQIYKQKLLSLKRGLMEDLLTGKVRVNSLIN